ncbi:hypothetical protein ACIBH1_45465 [Nonomuraea sp. NPDC050663]|uniref:hypothetical protein n=1 Tax=Nonomuraea sp. NPDC050663 TaxID=3364370 RepID=UPI0037BD2C8F
MAGLAVVITVLLICATPFLVVWVGDRRDSRLAHLRTALRDTTGELDEHRQLVRSITELAGQGERVGDTSAALVMEAVRTFEARPRTPQRGKN